MDHVVNNAEIKIFLSESCHFCRLLSESYSDLWERLKIKVLFLKPDSGFAEEYKKVREWFAQNNSEYAQYDFVVPVMTVEENSQIVKCFVGYPIINEIMSGLKEKLPEVN